MRQEERHTALLEGGYGEFVGDIHQAFDVVPGNRAFSATELTVKFLV
jgi:hypothetical protein